MGARSRWAAAVCGRVGGVSAHRQAHLLGEPGYSTRSAQKAASTAGALLTLGFGSLCGHWGSFAFGGERKRYGDLGSYQGAVH